MNNPKSDKIMFVQKLNELIQNDTTKNLGTYLYHKKRKMDISHYEGMELPLTKLKELEEEYGMKALDLPIYPIHYNPSHGFNDKYLTDITREEMNDK